MLFAKFKQSVEQMVGKRTAPKKPSEMSNKEYDIAMLRQTLYRDLPSDIAIDRLAKTTDMEKTGRYRPVNDHDGTLSKYSSDMNFVNSCLLFAMDRGLYHKCETREGKDLQFFACLLDKCARIAARELLKG
jgi:hypothetical protein